MGADFALILEPRPIDAIVAALHDDEIAAYYQAQDMPGAPPLDQIRDHVAQALARERLATEPDQAEILALAAEQRRRWRLAVFW